jgi:hypothetical protein
MGADAALSPLPPLLNDDGKGEEDHRQGSLNHNPLDGADVQKVNLSMGQASRLEHPNNYIRHDYLSYSFFVSITGKIKKKAVVFGGIPWRVATVMFGLYSFQTAFSVDIRV